jgi:hypothetical protein
MEFSQGEIKRYFESFKEDLKEIKDDIKVARLEDQRRFLAIEKEITDMKVKHEGYNVKVAGIVFVVTTAVSVVIVSVMNRFL